MAIFRKTLLPAPQLSLLSPPTQGRVNLLGSTGQAGSWGWGWGSQLSKLWISAQLWVPRELPGGLQAQAQEPPGRCLPSLGGLRALAWVFSRASELILG